MKKLIKRYNTSLNVWEVGHWVNRTTFKVLYHEYLAA